MPANATVPRSRSPTARARARRSASQPSATPVRDDHDRLDDLDREHVRRSSPRAARRATAASSRAASARRSGARSRWRCRGSPSRSTSPRARARRGRGSRPGRVQVVLTASTLAKNTRMPSGIDERTSRLSPRRSVSSSSTRAWRERPRASSAHASCSSPVSRRNTSSSERRPGAELGEPHVLVAQPDREVGDERRASPRRATTYSPGRASRTASAASPSAARERRRRRARRAAENAISSAAAGVVSSAGRARARRAARGRRSRRGRRAARPRPSRAS